MHKQTIIGIVIILLVIVAGGYLLMRETPSPVPAENQRAVEQPTESVSEGKLKVGNFEGTLQEVNHGCAYDAECYVVVDGKHITTMRGWSREIGGSADLDVLDAAIGKTVEVYAKDNGDGTYTLYGSEGFYVRPKN